MEVWLDNGVGISYSADALDAIRIHFPDGSELHTTGRRLQQLESALSLLRAVYLRQLNHAVNSDCSCLDPEMLYQIDSVLSSAGLRDRRQQ